MEGVVDISSFVQSEQGEQFLMVKYSVHILWPDWPLRLNSASCLIRIVFN